MAYLLRLGFLAALTLCVGPSLFASEFDWGRPELAETYGSEDARTATHPDQHPSQHLHQHPSESRDSIRQLAEWMTGSFSSAAQAEADSAFYDIRLEMVRIWEEHPEGFWLYVEQAASWALDKPYRQRVYHLREDGSGRIRSTVYSLPDPEAAAGQYSTPSFFDRVRVEELEIRQGCHILLDRVDIPEGAARTGRGATLPNRYYVGSTEDKQCQSSLRGASYATSEVVIGPDFVESWDRGWDGDDEQVWGAVKGAYVFDKVRNYGAFASIKD